MSVVLEVKDWSSELKEAEADLTDDEDNEETKEAEPEVEVDEGKMIKELSDRLGDLLFPMLSYDKSPELFFTTEQISSVHFGGTPQEVKKKWTDIMNKVFDECLGIVRMNSILDELQNSPIRTLTYQEFMKLNYFTVRMGSYTLDQFFARVFSYFRITSHGVYKQAYTDAGVIYEKEYKVMACFDKYDPCNNFNAEIAEKYLPFKSWDDMVSKVDEIWDKYPKVRQNLIADQLHPKKENDYTQAKRYYYINDEDFNGEYNSQCINDLYDRISNIGNIPLYQDGNSILMVCLGAMAKRHHKMIANYFYGVYSGRAKFQEPADDKLMSLEEGPIRRMYPSFRVNTVTTKRWSAGFHTIYGKSNSKRVLNAPAGYGVSYFDISSAEVRSAAYMSGDPTLIGQFEAGLDPYIELAKLKFGQDAPKSVLKANRKKYKVCLLAQLYGQSVSGMGSRLKISDQEAQEIVDQLRAHYPVMFKWIERKQNYCIANRRIETFLGDILDIYEFQAGRLKRVGINYCVQGNTAAMLAWGFFNLIKMSDKYNMGITPFIVVHDSSINYVPWKHLGILNEFYYEHFTEYVYKKTGIMYTFDTMIGADYTVPCVLSNEGDNIVLSGNDYALNDIVNSIGRDHIITEDDLTFDTQLTDPLMDLMYNFEAASFGTSTKESTIKFKLTGL